MTYYDQNNLFAKILRNEISVEKIYEDEKVLAFFDAYPVAPIHALLVPKGEYQNYYEFVQKAKESEIVHYFSSINKIVDLLKIQTKGFRLVTNMGASSGQSIFHFHTHIISGKNFEKLIG